MKKFLLIFSFLFLLAGCTGNTEEPSILVSLIADGRDRTFKYSSPVTVEQFLSEVDVELGESDRINPQPFTQISDGMRITIVRIVTEIQCEQETIPHERQVVPNEGLEPEEQYLAQAGENGVQEICYQITFQDGIRQEDQTPIGQPTIITEPQDEIIWVGTSNEVEPIPIRGTLAYINNGNAWVIQGNASEKRPITVDGNLDSFVFELTGDGNYLLYTSESDEEDFFNQLWIADTAAEANPVVLDAVDVLYADWVPNALSTISYSTGEARDVAPFWKALNNLWMMRIDPRNGNTLNVEQLIEEDSGGLYGWWGTNFEWSPDGSMLAWTRADSMGLVDLETGELNPLLQYPVFNTTRPWSWRANVSWSWDGELIATTVHGPPIGSEPAQNSPVFNVTVTDTQGSFSANVVDSAGIWSSPKYSARLAGESEFPEGRIAYLKSRRPHNSVNGEYDLVVADRDGSNQKIIFPRSGSPGITSEDFGLTAQDFAWSPNGEQIGIIYQGNLWIVDVESEVATQITFDGGASNPIWVG